MSREAWLILFWIIAVAMVLWVLVPPVAHLLGYSHVTFVTEAGAEDLWSERDGRWIGPIYRKLEEAGFRPLGRLRMEPRMDGAYWRGKIVLRLYVVDDVMASVYQLLPLEVPRFSFHTAFADGSLLTSAASMPDLVVNEGLYSRWGMDTNDPLALLAAHRQRVQERIAQGARVARHDRIEEFERMALVEWNSEFCKNLYRDIAKQNLWSLGGWSAALGFALWQEGGPMDGLRGAAAIISVVFVHVGCGFIGRVVITVQSWLTRRSVVEA
jgi:hypothetical protein